MFAVLEAAVAIFTLLVVREMYRQQRPWRAVLGTGVAMFAALTVMIAMWRGR